MKYDINAHRFSSRLTLFFKQGIQKWATFSLTLFLYLLTGIFQYAQAADTTPPTINSIVRQTPAGSYTNADSVVFRIAFSEDVQNVSTGDFTLSGTAAGDGTVNSVSTVSAGTYDVTITGLTSSNGTVNLDVSGSHDIADLVLNALVNLTPTGADETYTIDNIAPSAPSAPDMTSGTDLGSSNSDNLTSDSTPTFTGTSEASATITLISSVDGTVGSTTADGSGNWSVTASTLTEGAHNMSAVATDAAGNTSSASSALAINIDLTAPSAPSTPDMTSGTDTGSSNTDNITGDNTPTFTGTAVAGTVISLISSVDGIVGTDTADGSGNWSITAWSSMTEGGHNMTAVSSDAAGNVSSASSALSITIDTSAPAAPSTPNMTAGTDTGSSSTDNYTADTTPTFTGTSEASASITLISSVDGVVGTTSADGSGNWSITAASLTEGAHNITAVATDTAGNTSVASSALAITIDTTNPSAPSAPDMTSGTDLGSSNSDNLTSDSTPTFTGTSEASATITLISSVDGTVGSTTADGSGNWSVTASTLTEGAHNMTAVATDAAGNTSSASSALAINIDLTAPSAPTTPDMTTGTDTGSSNTDNITGDNTPTFTGTAVAGTIISLISSVDGIVGTDTADGSGNWSITAWSSMTEGGHNMSAVSSDAAGNVSSASSALSITIDTSAPAAPSTPNMTAGTDTGSSSTDNYTADTTPTFTGTSEANASITLISSVDGVVGTTSADGSGNWSITAASLTEGAHNITAVATDTAGNTSVASSALAITIDTTNPSAPSAPDMTSGTDLGSSNSDNLTSDSTPTFTGTSEASATITLISSVDGTVGSTMADGSGNWSVTASTLTEGAHNMTAVATDAAGNTSSASSALAINIDLTAPSAPTTPDMTTGTDTGSSNTDNITGDNTPTFTGTAVAGTVISLISSVDGIVGTDTADGSGNWSITAWSSMTEGGHNMTAVSSDSAGNVSSASSALSITIDTSAPAAPSTPNMSTGSDTGSSSTDNYTADTTPTFTGTADANTSMTLISSVDGVIATTTSDGSGNWSMTAATLTEGAHNITAFATDTAGNTSVASSALSITIDTTNPSAPSAPDMTTGTDLGSSNSDNLTSDSTPTFSGTSEANATITLISSVDGTVGSTTADGSGNWSMTASTLTEGAHNMTAVATDAAGNTSSASSALAINIDLTAPSAPSTPDMTTGTDTGSSNTDNITGDNTPTFTGTAVAGTVVSLISSVDGIVGTDTADGSGNWSITAASMTEDGHNMSAVSSDSAGNVSSASSALSITIDTTGPGTASGTLAVDENASNGTSVGTVTATDAISYALTDDAGGRFAIDSGTGAVTVADGSLLNHETNASHNITVRTTDVAANITDTPLSVTINNINDAPTITSTAITSANEDSAYSYTFTVDDEDSGDTLTLSAPTLPAWLSFNSTTGVLSGTPVNADVGPHSVLLRVNDGSVDVDQGFTITVNNTNDAPLVSGTPETRAIEGVAYSFTISATDDDVGDSVTYVIANNPAWLGINSGTGAVSGTPGSGDVGSDTGIQVGAYDGTTTTYLSAFAITVVGDLDGDSIGDDEDPDIDGDGMSNTYEDANGLDKYDAGDRDTDLDGDGVSNYDESVAGSNANADDYPPVVTPPADITVNATGLFTQVDVGTASATDALDGAVSASSDSSGYFKPGVNTVTWTATDAASNSATTTQTVNVVPMVNFSKDQNAGEGGSATIRVVLNGTAVTYPVTVPYTVSGTANGADHDLIDGSATITGPNLETTISVNLVDDGTGEGTETLVVTMGTPVNAVVGPKSTHTMSIYESNVSPMVDLAATQASVPTRIVEQGGANVVVTATVDDPNPGDPHTYDWSATDNALVDLDATAGTFTFSPDTVGVYTLRLNVTDSGSLSSDAVLTIRVVSALPTLGASDSDRDGIDDATEGSGDADNDGIADYLDSADLQQNTLQELSTTADSFLIETEPGLTLQLGDVAFRADHGSAGVTEAEIQTHANSGTGAVADSGYTYSGGLFDYAVHGLSTAGQSVVVVIPQFDTIPANAVYRKLTSSGWQDFVVDANNTVSSAAGAEGYCPPPGDAAYSSGLTEGHWCVQLSIEDGGPNDADDTADQKVEDPGGVTVSTSVPVSASSHSGGGGNLGWWTLMALLLVLATNYHKLLLSRRHRV